MQNSGRTHVVVIVVVSLALALLAAGGWWWFQPVAPVGGNLSGGNSSGLSQDNFSLAVHAVAATEEGEFQRATELWAELIEVLPNDPDIQVNRAVAVLKWIDTIEKELSSGNVTADRQPTLVKELDNAYGLAQEATAKLSSTEAADPRVALIESAVLASQANRLPYPTDQELRTQAAQVLQKSLDANPAQPLLAASFNDIVTVLAGDQPEIEARNRDYLFASWQADPRNLYLLRAAGEALLSSQDPRLEELLQPSLELTRPMWSMLESQIRRLDPDKMIPEVQAAIAAGKWEETRPLRFWFNIIRGMPGFLSDARLINPDPLALLDTSFLNRLAPPPSDDAKPLSGTLAYTALQATESAQAAIWYDVDFDRQSDVITARDSELRFFKVSDAGFTLEQSVAAGVKVIGILAVDLFEVDTPDRPMLPNSVAELMEATQSQELKSTNQEQPTGKRHDTLRELLVWGADGMRIIGLATQDAGNRQFAIHSGDTGLEQLTGVLHVEPADIESDGDLDLLVVSQSGLHVMQNNGNRTFLDISEYSSMPEETTVVLKGLACDFDRDMDQDFMLLTEDSSAAVFENILHGQFRFKSLASPTWQVAAASDIDFADFDGNASWDWLAAGPTGGSLTFTNCPAPGQLAATRTTDLPATGMEIEIGDVDNDGTLDCVTCGTAGVQIWRGVAPGRFAPPLTLTADEESGRSLSLMDRDYDGALDILALVNGQPTVWSLSGSSHGNFIDARIAGINDVNGGGRVNHYGLGSVLEVWAEGQLIPRYVRGPVTHLGLGTSPPTNLRIIFPNGLTQNVEDVSANTLVEEKQVLRGSCPYLYGWNGERFELITDLLWNAPLGLQVARGQTLPDRRWEYLLIPGENVQPRGDAYELRVTEELWEVAYFDNVTLSAVDHPADTDVFTNEKVGPPAIAAHQLFTVRDQVYPETAVDSHGRDVRSKLLETDRNYVQAFDEQICQGLCEPHFVELDFGDLSPDQPWRLFLNGWMYPTDTSLNIGIDQNPGRSAPEPPSLWVVDDQGKWVCARPFMGFPGGKPKSIVVDLSDVFVSEETRLRIGSSQQIYWDEAFVACDSDPSQWKITDLPLETAELRYRGFSQLLPREPDQPHWYNYQEVSTAPQWPPLDGPFTRFGEVREMLAQNDDRLVVMTSGDEIVMRFKVPHEPLAQGWKRDFVLHSVGWDKDADVNTLAGQGSLPLPFASQRSYPPPAEQAIEAEEVWRVNSETLGRFPSPLPYRPATPH